jgi:hypothetical protein
MPALARPKTWRRHFKHRQQLLATIPTPKQVSGLHLWFDASAITGLNDTDPVATWPDLAGFGNDATQGTFGSRPLYRTNILNGLPAIRYDGSDDWLTVLGTDMLALTNNATGISVLAVANLTDEVSATSREIITFSTNTETNARMKFGQRNATTNFWDISGRKLDADTQQNLLTAANTQTGAQVLTGVVDWANSNADIYRNGTNEASTAAWFTDGNTSATNSVSVIVGAKHTGAAPAEFWVGDLHEILVYNRAITTTERQFLEAYLTLKWLSVTAAPAVFSTSVSTPQLAVSVGAVPAATAVTVTAPQAVESVGAAPAVLPVTVTLPQAVESVGAAPAAIAVAATFTADLVGVGAAPAAIPIPITAPQLAVSVGASPTAIPIFVTMPQAVAAETVVVTPASFSIPVTFPQATVLAGATVTPARFTVAVSFPTATPSIAAVPLYFTPPHRGHLFGLADSKYPETMTEPLVSVRPLHPRPPNLWRHDDGLLHEEQPKVVTVNTKVFYGGAIHGPLSQADLDLIVASGYGAYLHPIPTPPEP